MFLEGMKVIAGHIRGVGGRKIVDRGRARGGALCWNIKNIHISKTWRRRVRSKKKKLIAN